MAISVALTIPRLSQKKTIKIHEKELLKTYYIRIWIYLQDVSTAKRTNITYIYIHKIKNAFAKILISFLMICIIILKPTSRRPTIFYNLHPLLNHIFGYKRVSLPCTNNFL